MFGSSVTLVMFGSSVTLVMFGSSVTLVVGGFMSCLRSLCLFVYYSGVPHISCCVFVLIFFVLCILCCQFLWIFHFCDCPFDILWRLINTGVIFTWLSQSRYASKIRIWAFRIYFFLFLHISTVTCLDQHILTITTHILI